MIRPRPKLLGTAALAGCLLLAVPAAAQQAAQPNIAANQAARSAGDDPVRGRSEAGGGVGPAQFGSGESAGAMDQKTSGFSSGIWRESRPQTLVNLLKALPAQTRSSAMHDIARRLLATTATPPEGTRGFLRLRVEKLMAMGELGAVADIGRAAGGASADEAVSRMSVDAQFSTGQIEAACLDTRAVAMKQTGPFWQTALHYCRGWAGEPGFGSEGIPYGQELRTEAARNSAIARNPRTPQDQRLNAAVIAARWNAIPATLLGDILRKSPGAPGALADGAPYPSDGRALAGAWHQLDQAKDPVARGRLLANLLARTDEFDISFVALTDLFREAPMLFEPKPTGPSDPAMPRPAEPAKPVAPIVARAMFSAGDGGSGEEWANLGKGVPGMQQVAPFLAAIGDETARQKYTGGSPRLRAALAGLDRKPAGNDGGADTGHLPSIGELAALDEAAAAGRIGETVLRALVAMGPDGPTKAHPVAVNRAIAALRTINQRADAEALAFEAIGASLRDRGGE